MQCVQRAQTLNNEKNVIRLLCVWYQWSESTLSYDVVRRLRIFDCSGGGGGGGVVVGNNLRRLTEFSAHIHTCE